METGVNNISFTLPPQMTAETADALCEALTQLPLGHNPSLTLDASQVERFSASGAQILIALEKTIASAEGKLTITGKSEFLTQAFHDIGLGWLAHNA